MIYQQPLYGPTDFQSPFLNGGQVAGINQQPAQSQSPFGGGGSPPIGLIQQFAGGEGGGIGGLFGGGGSSATGAAGAEGAGAAAGGGEGALAAAGPWAALAAIIALNENYQGNIGNRDDEKFPLEYGLTGRGAYKDAPGWAEKADEQVEGLGSGIRIAGNLSSPVDLFRGETYSNLWDDLKRGGTVGSVLKGLF